MNDLDQPPVSPGKCPNCGQLANIWNPAIWRYECPLCEWAWKPGDCNPAQGRQQVFVVRRHQ